MKGETTVDAAMNILLIGSGGREHALAWKLAQSPSLGRLHVAPGNVGTVEVATNVALDAADHDAVAAFVEAQAVDLVVIGPEAPLVAGLADALRARGVAVFGPSAAAAQLEGSKHFTKTVCDARDIPTARYARFNNAPAARRYVRMQGAPIVVKADGLAAGKGVTVADSVGDAFDAIEDIMSEPGATLVVEERLEGTEASMFFLCDGERALPFGSAQDHKRAFDGDRGPNTGGMGAFSPSPYVTPEIESFVQERMIEPTLAEMAARGAPFTGVLYAGLMLTAEGPKLIEYNVRFGDPECQALMLRFEGDLARVLHDCALGRLRAGADDWSADAAVVVVLAASGYPGAYERGSRIAALPIDDETVVFHAGTTMRDGELVATGGRVLNIAARGADVAAARAAAYRGVAAVDWREGFSRSDIAAR